MNKENENRTDNVKIAIRAALENPAELERLYRSDRAAFRKAFNSLYPDISDRSAARFWNERLNFEREDISWGRSSDLAFVLIASFIAGIIAKVPDFTTIDKDFYYPRNIAFVVFPLLTAYFAWKEKMTGIKLLFVSVLFLLSAVYINTLPGNEKNHTFILSCIHLPLFLWSLTGYVFVGGRTGNRQGRLDFLKFNGDLVVMTSLILIAGGLLSGITVGLFELIDIDIHVFYGKHVIVWGLAASPIVGTYLIRSNPQLVDKVSPVIAKVFTPLVFITLVIYLAAVVITGKDPYNDREFLLVFNALLIGVVAIIFFSISENTQKNHGLVWILLLFCLSVVTLVLNGIALSAILFRIGEWGITPNRLAVLGSNALMLANLLLIAFRLLKSIRKGDDLPEVGMSIAAFLPLYSAWTMLVAFLAPIAFGFV